MLSASFSDAEAGEDGGEEGGGGDGAGDGREVGDGLAQGLRHQVGREAGGEAGDDAFCGGEGPGKGFGMARVGHKHVAGGGGHFRGQGGEDAPEVVEPGAGACRQG